MIACRAAASSFAALCANSPASLPKRNIGAEQLQKHFQEDRIRMSGKCTGNCSLVHRDDVAREQACAKLWKYTYDYFVRRLRFTNANTE
jgi:hypothetical protein